MTRIFRTLAAVLFGLCIVAAPALAQGWPAAKTIAIVVPTPPGPSIDMIARMVASSLSETLGQSVIVENRSGAMA